MQRYEYQSDFARMYLAVATDRVSDAAWREIYEKARHVASLWAPRSLGIERRNIGVALSGEQRNWLPLLCSKNGPQSPAAALNDAARDLTTSSEVCFYAA